MDALRHTEQEKHEHKARSPINKHTYVRSAVVILVAAVLVGLAVWLPMNRQNAKLNSSLSQSKSNLAQSAAANKRLAADNTRLSAQIATLTAGPSLPKLTVIADQHFNGTPNQYNSGEIFAAGTDDFLLVKVSVTNQSGPPTGFKIDDIKLKDASNTVYPYYTGSAVGGQPRFSTGVDNLPSGFIEIHSQSLNSGETVQGTLIFYVPQALKEATLYYGNQALAITPTLSTN